jgi:hypothetical protein
MTGAVAPSGVASSVTAEQWRALVALQRDFPDWVCRFEPDTGLWTARAPSSPSAG